MASGGRARARVEWRAGVETRRLRRHRREQVHRARASIPGLREGTRMVSVDGRFLPLELTRCHVASETDTARVPPPRVVFSPDEGLDPRRLAQRDAQARRRRSRRAGRVPAASVRSGRRLPPGPTVRDDARRFDRDDQRLRTTRLHARVLYLYVPDVDATFARAVEAGAVKREAPQDTPYGDRRAMVEDPGGNVWQIATRKRR